MKLELYHLTRTWPNGETTTHIFAGDRESDKFYEIKQQNLPVDMQEVQQELTYFVEKQMHPAKGVTLPMSCTKQFLKLTSSKLTRIL